MNITNLTAQQLRQAADIREKIESLTQELGRLLGDAVAAATHPLRRKSKLSPQGLANIRAGVRKRTAKQKSKTPPGGFTGKRKRHLSPAIRAKRSAIAKARWAKARAEGRTHL